MHKLFLFICLFWSVFLGNVQAQENIPVKEKEKTVIQENVSESVSETKQVQQETAKTSEPTADIDRLSIDEYTQGIYQNEESATNQSSGSKMGNKLSPGFSNYYITIVLMLVILGVLIFLSNKLKTRGGFTPINLPFSPVKGSKNIKIIEKQVLEPRKTLYIVNVGAKNWLLASSDTNLQLISEVNIDEGSGDAGIMTGKTNEVNKKSKGKTFSDFLNLPVLILLIIAGLFIFGVDPVYAQDINSPNFLDQIDLRAPVKLKELVTPLQLIIFMAFLTLLPFIFIMTTSFIRTVVVLGFVRQAIGTQQIPPNQVILGISIFLTIYIMSPVWGEINDKALAPYLDHKISQSVAFDRGIKPIRTFMLKYTKKEELAFFMRVVKLPQPKTAEDVPMHVLIPAYMVSELATAFKIGFFLFLPFLVVDLVVANTLLALGMMMLSPVTISMPFKLLVFTLANGWYLVLQALVTSFKL